MQLRTLLGGLALAGVGIAGIAWADSTGAPGAPVPDTRLRCRTFPTDLGAEIDTRDATSELGKWVIDLEDRGWVVQGIDWEVGQKPTGFPQGFTHVCLAPLRASSGP